MSEIVHYSRVDPWVYPTISFISRTCLRIYFREIQIQGKEHLPSQGPAVLAPKHYSRWDPLVLDFMRWQPLRYMTNANQFEGVQGWLIERLGAFPVDLAKPQLSAMRHTVELLQQGCPLVMFPEGGIVRDRPLRELKSGLARLVLQAESSAAESSASEPLEIPIIPIALHYVPDSLFQARVFVKILPPLHSKSYRGKNDKETAKALTHALQEALLTALDSLATEHQTRN